MNIPPPANTRVPASERILRKSVTVCSPWRELCVPPDLGASGASSLLAVSKARRPKDAVKSCASELVIAAGFILFPRGACRSVQVRSGYPLALAQALLALSVDGGRENYHPIINRNETC